VKIVYQTSPILEFRVFLEQEEEKFDSIKADIPLSEPVHKLSGLFSQFGEKLFVVGGAVRDYLHHRFHDPDGKYAPKDFDVATEAQPERVMELLSSPQARRLGIRPLPKGESFGVISAILDGEEIEIATFREEWYDPEAGDGRRPDEVSFSTPAKDAQRRDLTINALFYDIEDKEIRDYNLDEDGQGHGFKDIRSNSVKPVGDARSRFREDKLRVARLVRFFSRFNPGEIRSHLTPDVLDAVEEFKDMHGVSGERVAAEFMSGLGKAKSPANYLKNWESLNLMPTLFPGLRVNLDGVERVDNRNLKAVMAWIFRDNTPKDVRTKLNKLKYPNNVSDGVAYLMGLVQHGEGGTVFHDERVAQHLRKRDAHKQLSDAPEEQPDGSMLSPQEKARREIHGDIRDFSRMSGVGDDAEHFLQYEPGVQSQDFMHLPPHERGTAMSDAERERYRRSRQGG
jgi:tRNA nucleotidyltransferase/poly(A) polymerase